MLDHFPRFPLAFLPTPLVELEKLSKYLGGPRIFIKRDDQTGLAFGGNKVRKLEFLLGHALAKRHDTIITVGATQSNHCRQTAAAATKAGLVCHLVLGGTSQDEQEPNGNLLLDKILHAEIHWSEMHERVTKMQQVAENLKSKGHSPYLIPYGGSNAIGALGFILAIKELKSQLVERKLTIEHIVFASSSGGTQAGIVAGAKVHDLSSKILGIAIDKGDDDIPLCTFMADLAGSAAKQLGTSLKFTEADFIINDSYLGEGYGVVGDLEKEAIQVMARTEGIFLDPVYTGRAFGALVDLISKREFSKHESVLFWHTGGTPALFHYAKNLI